MSEVQGFKRETEPCIERGVHRTFICSTTVTVHLYAFKHHKHKEQPKLGTCTWPAALLLSITNSSNSSSSSLFNNGNVSAFSKANASLVYTVNTVIYVKVRISARTLTNFNSVHVSRIHIMEQCHANTIST